MLDAALATVEEGGPGGLTVRQLAAAAGTSTMSVYTHFGSISAVVGAVIERGFEALAGQLTAVGTTDDALADLFGLALAYLDFARAHPRLYAAMFQYTSADWQPDRRRNPVTEGSPTSSTAGAAAFGALAAGLSRFAVDGEAAVGPAVLAAQCWSAIHGVAMLRMAGHLGDDDVTESLLVALALGNGVERAEAQRAWKSAVQRRDAAVDGV